MTALYGGGEYFRNREFGSPQSGGYHGYRDYVSDRQHIEEKFSDVLRLVESLRPPGDLLDVGAGPGFLMSAARRRGWRPVGIELNPWAVRYATETLSLDVRLNPLGAEPFEPSSFDAVTMMDLLEHTSSPVEVVAEAARVLRRDGVLAVLTPDAGSPVSRALGARWPEIQRVPEHLVLFSVRGLASLLHRCGLDVVAWHSIGKRSQLRTLVADVSPVAPAIGRWLGRVAERSRLADRVVEIDPHTKFCLYARHRAAVGDRGSRPVPRRSGALRRSEGG